MEACGDATELFVTFKIFDQSFGNFLYMDNIYFNGNADADHDDKEHVKGQSLILYTHFSIMKHLYPLEECFVAPMLLKHAGSIRLNFSNVVNNIIVFHCHSSRSNS